MTRRIGFVIHPGFQFLDVVGPVAAFEIASRYVPDGYGIDILAPQAGSMVSSSGLALAALPLDADGFDTIVVSGGQLVTDMGAFRSIVAWLRDVRPRRLASVCSGAFLLAEAGRLDGRAATTHWESAERFRRRYPKIRLEPDRIFTRDGDVWTSAGISAGIDLALALIEDDLGQAIVRRTAQQLVVHSRRPGGQSQFSGLLELGGLSGRFETLVEWIKANLTEPLTVERLAERAIMSPRNFARAFLRDTGTTPAKAVEHLRIEAARHAVETGTGSLEQIARGAGFNDAARMRRAFLRVLGQSPQALRPARWPPDRATS
ncbi:GlxA family transcriptional regulator [Devosia sp. Root635]|uniref:GlxA family transcriptional regulator n=1 Tax=Devosia sp. Root635 TaxID=1736575 RepID=UPI0006F23E7E|nr:GlxA family transcriptional regulator [Devosia sp. Root635]KRA40220.1 AraC family transcriptional regulator [Devosia sp. Root635]